ncbi:RNA polymerase sigma factor [Promicromonospora sp. NPDC019610]|uniref:RNA polymerase sigma factor n=1 Tax=Promicromonospora sp. NPDC019610 TaxID=3364405 RepID=UPI003797969D
MAQWEAELTELVARRGGLLVGYAYSLCRDRAQAEDLVQDALVKVYSRLRRVPAATPGHQVVDLDQPRLSSPEAYVRRAILTIFLDGYRRENRWSGVKHLLVEGSSSSGVDHAVALRVDVGVALRQLSPRQREVVTLRFFEDMTVPQIATELGTRPGTIKRYLSNAMEQLQGLLVELPAPAVDADLDERLGAVAGAVRRRRAAKVGVVTGVSLVLAGLLTLAAFLGPGRLLSEPVPPAVPRPDAAVGGSWAPGAWRQHGAQYRCGMDVSDLGSTSDRVRLELTGEIRPAVGHVEALLRITRTDADGPQLDGGEPMLVFAQAGRVVDIGRGWQHLGYDLPAAGGSMDAVADARAATACGSWTMRGGPWEEYRDARPAGTYDVYAAMPWIDTAGGRGIAVSEPVTMEVPAVDVPVEASLDVDIRDGYQPPWLSGTDLACGVHASAIPGSRETSGLQARAETTGPSEERVAVTFFEADGEPVDTVRSPVTLVWLSDGRVVGVGRDVGSEPVQDLRIDEEGEVTVVVPVGPDRSCLADPDAGMPPGDYQLFAMTELEPGSGGERRFRSVHVTGDYGVEGS